MLTIHKPTRGSSSLFCIFCTKDFYKCGHNNVLELPNIDTRPGMVFIRGLLLVITNPFSLNINKTAVRKLLLSLPSSSLIHFTSLTLITTMGEGDTLSGIFAIILLWQLLKQEGWFGARERLWK